MLFVARGVAFIGKLGKLYPRDSVAIGANVPGSLWLKAADLLFRHLERDVDRAGPLQFGNGLLR